MADEFPLTFKVTGKPITQGSMRVFNGHITHNKSAELLKWRKAVGTAAQQFIIQPLEGAVVMTLKFHLLKPKTVKREKPTVPPDADKLARAVFDALTGIIYKDDSQVIKMDLEKCYSSWEGVEIMVDRA